MFKNTLPKNKCVHDMDQKQFLIFLQKNYNTQNFDQLEQLLKKDLKNKENLFKLIENSGYEKEEFLYYTISMFDSLFNKIMIKNVKENINEFSKRSNP
jgi:hypothetical protein